MQENNSSMDINAQAGSLSRLEIQVLRNELIALRDRVANLERQLSNIKQYKSEQCVFCQGSHQIRSCEYFKYLQVTDRWALAKKLNLCYRCLEKSHHGLDCPYSKRCGVNRCKLTHSELLHNEEKRKTLRKLKATRRVPHSDLSPFGPVSDRQPSQIEDLSGNGSDCDILDSSSEECLIPENHLNPVPHTGMTVPCDGEMNSENIDELNRLAMLAETNVPFDVIFGGSCGKELGSSQSRNMTSNFNLVNKFSYFEGQPSAIEVPSGHENDSSYNEYVDPAVKHPCPIEVVVKFNHENASANDETDSEVNSLDPLGGYDPFRPPGDGKKHEYQNGETHEHGEPSGGKDKTVDFEPEDKGGGPVECSPLIMAMYNSGMFYSKCKMPAEYQKRFNEESAGNYIEMPSGTEMENHCALLAGPKTAGYPTNADFGEKETSTVPPSGRFCEELDDSASLGTKAEVELKQFIQKFGQNKTALLDVLSNQVSKLNEEINLHEKTTSPAPLAEEQQKQSTSSDLSVWLMPVSESDPGGS